MIRLLILLAFLCAGFELAPQAHAQSDRPLYNSKTGTNNSGNRSLYNSGSAGIRPLSLRQIVEGRGEGTGGTVSRYDRTYQPYNTNTSGSRFSSHDEVARFRAAQADRARRSEERARKAMLNYREDSKDQSRDERTQGYLNRFQNTNATRSRVSPKPRVIYNERRQENMFGTPERVFNSVR